MNNVVGAIRSFEQMGDAALVPDNSAPAGELDGRSVAGSQAQSEVLDAVGDMIRNTPGLGPKAADIAARVFGDIAAKGKPVTGREAAAVISALVYNLEMETNFDPQKTLEEFAAYLASRPLDELRNEDMPRGVTLLNRRQIEDFIDRNTMPAPAAPAAPAAPPAAPPVPMGIFDSALADLHAMRDNGAMGGSPNYPDGIPTRDGRGGGVWFFGIPYETAMQHAELKAREGGIFAHFWRMVASYFRGKLGLGQQQTTYENRYLQVENMKLLGRHWETIKAAFDRGMNEGKEALATLAHLYFHPEDNGGEQVMGTLRAALELFEAAYVAAKAKGPETLERFFTEGLAGEGGACLPARIRSMQAFLGRLRTEETAGPATGLARLPENNQHVGALCCVLLPNRVFERPPRPWAEVRAFLLEHAELQGDLPRFNEKNGAATAGFVNLREEPDYLDHQIRAYLENNFALEFTDDAPGQTQGA